MLKSYWSTGVQKDKWSHYSVKEVDETGLGNLYYKLRQVSHLYRSQKITIQVPANCCEAPLSSPIVPPLLRP